MSTVLDNVSDNGVSVFEFADSARKERLWTERLINYFAGITQFVTWPFLFLFFHSFLDVRIEGQNNFKSVRSPFIIVSHHVAYYDSFIFRLVLGIITAHLPLRFMAVTKFDWKVMNCLANIGIVDFIYSLFGVFTVTPGLGIDKNLEKAREIIKVGGNIVIYPEGKVTKIDGIGTFKHGAATLIKETGVSIIPVSFRLGKRNLLRRRFYINIGGPMHILREMTVEEITGSLHKEMEELYGKV